MASARAKRYAKAVFELAQEDGAIDAWQKRLDAIQAVLTDPTAVTVLSSPALGAERRAEIVEEIADPKWGKEGLNLARMLVAVRRPDLITGIVEEYGRLADEAAGRVRATAVTAVELGKADEDRLAKSLSERMGKEVRLDVKVDPAIVGGLVLHVGDRLIDASVASRLQQLRRRLAMA